MLFVMILLSGIILLVVSVSRKIYVGRQLARTYERQYMMRKALANTICLIKALVIDGEKGEEKKEGQKEDEGSKSKDKKKQEIALFKRLWNCLYKNKKYVFTESNDGVDAEVNLYMMIEDGKIPFTRIIRDITEQKKNKKADAQEAEGDAENKESAHEDGEAEKEEQESPLYKKIMEYYNALVEKGSAFKNTEKAIEKKTGKKNEGWFNGIMKYWMKHANCVRPLSLWDLIIPIEKDLDDVKVYGESGKEGKEYYLGDVLAPYTETMSLLYVAPGFIEACGVKNFEYNGDMIKKIIEEGEKIIKHGERDVLRIWEILYEKNTKAQIKKDIISDAAIKKIFSANIVPDYISAFISIKIDSIIKHYVVFFSKCAQINDEDPFEYAVFSVFLI